MPEGAAQVSFVVLVCDDAPHVAVALRAALAQDQPPMEIVVSDNASTDGSPAIVATIAAGYAGPHRLIIDRQDRRLDPVSHLAAAVARSSGEILVLAAGRDRARPARTARAIAALRDGGADLAASSIAAESGTDGPGRRVTLEAVIDGGAPELDDGTALAIRRRLIDGFVPLDGTRAPPGWGRLLALRAALGGGCVILDEALIDRPPAVAAAPETALGDELATRIALLQELRTCIDAQADREELKHAYRRLQGRAVLTLYDWTFARNELRRSGLRPTWEASPPPGP